MQQLEEVMLSRTWQELDIVWDVCLVTKEAKIETALVK
jgi:hypothetical protein